MTEQWRPINIPGCVHEYLISSRGRVKRAPGQFRRWNHLTGRHNFVPLPERVFRLQSGRGGYLIVTLQLGGGRQKAIVVAPTVCRIFNGPKPSPEMHCAHLNGDRTDNRAENLAWVTPKQNEAHKALHGTKMLGERHHAAKLTDADVLAIRSATGTCAEIGKRFGISPTNVCDIQNRKTWVHVH